MMNTIYENTEGTSTSNSINSNIKNNYSGNSTVHYSSTSSSLSLTEEQASRTSNNDISSDLKIIGQLKNIEKINEQRRRFLDNTLSEYSIEKTSEQRIFNGSSEAFSEDSTQAFNGINGTAAHSSTETTTTTKSGSLKPPVTPPPKPPMLSRSRSQGGSEPAVKVADDQVLSTPAIITTTTTTTTVPTAASQEPQTAASNEITEKVKQPSTTRIQRPMSLIAEMTSTTTMSPTDSQKFISINHYERLIEELKCPGCAYPMKAPILLCQTGHSVCQQCTRILLLCPLCKEPFTNMRSRTIEALCSKAHFRCTNASGGCMVRLQYDLLSWHERQCAYKPMKCFMGRVWGDCQWNGREAFWKDHLESDHANKMFKTDSADLIWNMNVKQKPLTGYYVFEVFDEMFNFYEVYDRERILFTMTCTSSIKEKKHNFAYEVTMIHEDNEALAITQKYPVHSEYDKDILMDGTCVSISMSDLAKFIDEDKMLHYRVRVLQVKSPRKAKTNRKSNNQLGMHPIDFQQTQIEGVNLKNVPSDIILTRKTDEIPYVDNAITPTSTGSGVLSSEDDVSRIRQRYSSKPEIPRGSDSESDPEFDAFVAKKWGTPQLNFNRKFLKNISSDSSGNGDDSARSYKIPDDKLSISSTSYKKRVSNTLRKSFRTLKAIDVKPFLKKSPEKTIAQESQHN